MIKRARSKRRVADRVFGPRVMREFFDGTRQYIGELLVEEHFVHAQESASTKPRTALFQLKLIAAVAASYRVKVPSEFDAVIAKVYESLSA